jgi:hypothetical protein
MTLKALSSLGTYDEINRGAHRKAVSIIGVPSLVRHLGFWNVGISSGQPTALSHEIRASNYEKYVKDLVGVLEGSAGADVYLDRGALFQSDVDIDTGTVSLIRFWWHGMRATVRLEFHTEYITLASILDLSVKPHPDYSAAAGTADPQRELRERLLLLQDLFEKEPRNRRQDYASISRLLQYEIWKKFEEDILDRAVAGKPILETTLGQVFVDLRAIVTGSTMTKGQAQPAGRAKEQGWTRSKTVPQALRRPFSHAMPRKRTGRKEYRAPGSKWARDSLRRLWPLIESERYLQNFEFSVSGVFGGRALLVTALGPRPPALIMRERPWQPVCYFVHAYTDDEWQIGRLIDRINTLASLRLAAVMEIGSLNKAGAMVECLAKRIQDANRAIEDAIEESNDKDKQPDWCDKAEQEMHAVTEDLQAINGLVSGNILRRLERSQYYVEQFQKDSKALRARRIEGFQLYSEFVNRRMGSSFGYIQYLRTRMDSINAGMSALARSYSALKIASVTVSMEGLIRSMTKQDAEIEKIQDFGEVALIGFLIPYYVGTVLLEHVFPPQSRLFGLFWPVLISLFVTWVLIRNKQKQGDDPWKGRRNFVRWIFVGYLIVIWAAYAASWFLPVERQALSAAAESSHASKAAAEPAAGASPK